MLDENKLGIIIQKKALLDQEMVGVLLSIVGESFKKYNDAYNGLTLRPTTPEEKEKFLKDGNTKSNSFGEAVARKDVAKEIQDRCLDALSGYLGLQLKEVKNIISENDKQE